MGYRASPSFIKTTDMVQQIADTYNSLNFRVRFNLTFSYIGLLAWFNEPTLRSFFTEFTEAITVEWQWWQ